MISAAVFVDQQGQECSCIATDAGSVQLRIFSAGHPDLEYITFCHSHDTLSRLPSDPDLKLVDSEKQMNKPNDVFLGISWLPGVEEVSGMSCLRVNPLRSGGIKVHLDHGSIDSESTAATFFETIDIKHDAPQIELTVLSTPQLAL